MPLKIIACEVLKEEILAACSNNYADFEFIPQGLHAHPERLQGELQGLLDMTKGYSRVIMAFGLCGGSVKNLRARDFILTIPRVHDCIALLLGSKNVFDEVRKEEPGTLYLSAGWLKGESQIISEYRRATFRYGETRALGILKRIYGGYKRVLFIQTDGPRDKGRYIEKSLEVAGILGLPYQEMSGNPYLIRKLVSGPWDDELFITVQPGGVVEEFAFLE